MISRLSILFILILTSCSDLVEELPGKYTYRFEGTDLIDISHESDWEKTICGRVEEYTYNDKIIVAKESPLYENYRDAIVHNLNKIDTNWTQAIYTTEEFKIREKVADSILRTNPKYIKLLSSDTNYWIIDVAKDSLLGPYNYEEYLKQRKLLNIPVSVDVN
ncbi:MAG: DUF3997 domain-containing protein [Chitinophagales bacterium]|nr:DUF3997 domain-containing protein [Chitinophagales bacterium]